MQYKQHLSTANASAGSNTCQYIILHHTATGEGTIKGVLRTLTVGKVSCHYVVDTNGDIYKIGEDKMILWHAGESVWKGKRYMNKYAIGIEIIGPLGDKKTFTDAQRSSVRELVGYLATLHKIPAENVLRHKDVSPGRKVDIYDSFWSGQFKTYEAYRLSLFTKDSPEKIAATNKLIKLGVTSGERPDDLLLRKDMAKMVERINPTATGFWNFLEADRAVTRSEFVKMAEVGIGRKAPIQIYSETTKDKTITRGESWLLLAKW